VGGGRVLEKEEKGIFGKYIKQPNFGKTAGGKRRSREV